ncbi:MBL fold metallo-hydrolase [Rhodothermus profundi]|uniref:Ribonuclease Z n=1 Tax=Rhodothermus profundi TaxID=633813 RepID=A0A1M6PBM9_9BACT|nr:MBL fold metallo-hydrolase [Rhodothermus profundi]SHK05348.1 ribonuclease Z [Rhodothermus profundi]
MPSLYLLGTGAAVSDPHRTTTILAVADEASLIVVDCGGDVIQRMLAAGLDPVRLTALILTHEHPDHTSGFPLFMERIWLLGRREPIPIYGIQPAIDQARRCFDTYNTATWEGLPTRDWREVPYQPGALVLENERWRIRAWPVVHPVPTVGLRFEHLPTGRVIAYSCDTEPTEAILELGRHADILVHEATGEGPGHTSPEAAARQAARAGARRLLLVHLPPGLTEASLTQARQHFADTELGVELGRYDL